MTKEKSALRKRYNKTLLEYCRTFSMIRNILDLLEDGEAFDYDMLSGLLQQAEVIGEKLNELRQELSVTGGYNVALTIPLQGCRLEEGRLIGTDVTRAMSFADQWLQQFPVPNTDCTLYEMGAYLKCLEQQIMAESV